MSNPVLRAIRSPSPKQELVPLYIEGPGGMGDCIYIRPFVRELAGSWDAYLETPWPEIFDDLDVKFVPHRAQLRTQDKNMARFDGWAERPQPPYNNIALSRLPNTSVMGSFLHQCPVPEERFVFDLTPGTAPPIRTRKPVAVIRPVTIRSEWPNHSRAPKAEYISHAAKELRERGFYVVSIADVDPPQEWFDGDPPPADKAFHGGELRIRQLIGLFRLADVVVGGVGFILPMALATGTPLIMVAGGSGRTEHPDQVTHPWIDTSRTAWLFPEPYCMCNQMDHGCNKDIPDFPEKFGAALDEVLA